MSYVVCEFLYRLVKSYYYYYYYYFIKEDLGFDGDKKH